MGFDTDALLTLWTPLKVNCCNSKEFTGYLCGASDGNEADLVLCSIPEMKIIFVSGWAIEKIEVSHYLFYIRTYCLEMIISKHFLRFIGTF